PSPLIPRVLTMNIGHNAVPRSATQVRERCYARFLLVSDQRDVRRHNGEVITRLGCRRIIRLHPDSHFVCYRSRFCSLLCTSLCRRLTLRGGHPLDKRGELFIRKVTCITDKLDHGCLVNPRHRLSQHFRTLCSHRRSLFLLRRGLRLSGSLNRLTHFGL